MDTQNRSQIWNPVQTERDNSGSYTDFNISRMKRPRKNRKTNAQHSTRNPNPVKTERESRSYTNLKMFVRAGTLFVNIFESALCCSSPGFLFSLFDSVRTPRLIFIEIEMNSIFDCAFWFKTHPYSYWFFMFALIMSAWCSLFGHSVRLIVAACVRLFGMINNI